MTKRNKVLKEIGKKKWMKEMAILERINERLRGFAEGRHLLCQSSPTSSDKDTRNITREITGNYLWIVDSRHFQQMHIHVFVTQT